MSEYVLMTTTERYRTLTDHPDLEKVGEYEYHFFGKKMSTFTVCRIANPDIRITIQGVKEVFPDNVIPLKVFPKSDSVEDIVKEIYELDLDEENRIIQVS